jgi:hypothetical protein
VHELNGFRLSINLLADYLQGRHIMKWVTSDNQKYATHTHTHAHTHERTYTSTPASRRRNFDKWFKQTWTTVKIPGKGTVYDYFVNPKTQKFQPWAELVTDIDYDGNKPMWVHSRVCACFVQQCVCVRALCAAVYVCVCACFVCSSVYLCSPRFVCAFTNGCAK